MKGWNIYYQNKKLNDIPLSQNDISKLYNKTTIEKINNGHKVIIPLKRCRIIECVIV